MFNVIICFIVIYYCFLSFFSATVLGISSNTDDSPYHIDKKCFQEKINEYLSSLNQAPDVLYREDALTVNPELLGQFLQKLASINFEEKMYGEAICFSYKGDNPAQGIEQLFQLRPLILDCRLALSLCSLLAIKHCCGIMRFNRNNQILTIGALGFDGFHNHIFYRRHHRNGFHKDALCQVECGDLVYILGPEDGFAYKPSSANNGFYAACTRVSDGIPYFNGFGLDEEHTFDDLIKLMLHHFSLPLTPADWAGIVQRNLHAPYDVARFSSKTNWQIWSDICHSRSKDNNGEKALKVPSSLTATKIVGILSISKLSGRPYEETVHFDDEGIDEIGEDIYQFSFELNTTAQRKLYRAFHNFFEECLLAKNAPSFGGLIVFGDPGAGKTHLSNAFLGLLERNNVKIWRQDFGQAKISSQDPIYAPNLNQVNQNDVTAYFLRLLNEEWRDIDVFYLAHFNEQNCLHMLVASSALAYARMQKKRVLINSNFSPFLSFDEKILNKSGDALEILHVKGQELDEKL